jgi:malonyl-CoA O-methyltransferase
MTDPAAAPAAEGAAREALPPLVLLHGWGADSRTLTPLADLLGAHAPVTALDLPGFGTNAAVDFPHDLAALLDFLDARVAPGSVLVGWSLGGALALRLAERFPSKVRAVVSIATNPCFVRRVDWPHGMDAASFRDFRAGVADEPERQLERFGALQARSDRHERAVHRRLRGSRVRGAAGENLLRALDTLAALDLRGTLPALTQPVLHIFGTRDRLVPVQVADDVRRLQPGVSVFTVDGAAHAPFLSAPRVVAARILDFLQARFDAADGARQSKQEVARSFSRAAAAYDTAAHLQRDVGNALLERLPRAKARTVLDLGSGTGHFVDALRRAYPEARLVGLDIAEGMLRAARARHPADTSSWLCADAELLPLRERSVDLVFSNLALQWCADLPSCFRELARVLSGRGHAVLSTLGPDTLWELRAAWRQLDQRVHVNRFTPLGEIQRAAQAAGLELRYLSVYQRELGYPDVASLARELRALGAHNLNQGRAHGLAGRALWRRLEAAYGEFRRGDGALPASYQVVEVVLGVV